MENHQIMLQPSFLTDSVESPLDILDNDSDKNLKKTVKTVSSNSLCEAGSVPIKKMNIKRLARFSKFQDFFKRRPHNKTDSTRFFKPGINDESIKHRYAKVFKNVDNWGIKSAISLFNPYTERSSEFSFSQIWASGGNPNNLELESVEAGVQRYDDKYNGKDARLFIYFTPDNYLSRGCYNLDCAGFVQTNHSYFIGGAFTEYSKIG